MKHTYAELDSFLKNEIEQGEIIKNLFIQDKLTDEVSRVEEYVSKLQSIRERLFELNSLNE